jgi:hypothetical protein
LFFLDANAACLHWFRGIPAIWASRRLITARVTGMTLPAGTQLVRALSLGARASLAAAALIAGGCTSFEQWVQTESTIPPLVIGARLADNRLCILLGQFLFDLSTKLADSVPNVVCQGLVVPGRDQVESLLTVLKAPDELDCGYRVGRAAEPAANQDDDSKAGGGDQ